MNTPDEKLFVKKDIKDFKAKLQLNDKFVTVYVGGINPERNLEVIIKALTIVKKDIPEVFFLLFGHTYGLGGGKYKEELESLAKSSGLENNVYFGGKLSGEEVASYLDLAHYGVISYVANPMTELAMPNKVFEYIALGKPVIACRLKGLYKLLGDDAAVYYEPEDEKDLAQKIRWVYQNKSKAEEMNKKAFEIYKKHSWSVMKRRLNDLYKGL